MLLVFKSTAVIVIVFVSFPRVIVSWYMVSEEVTDIPFTVTEAIPLVSLTEKEIGSNFCEAIKLSGGDII